MPRAALIVACVAFSIAAPVHADETRTPAPAVTSTPPSPTQTAFSILVSRGDKAASRGNRPDALRAYLSALELQDDPTVHGRAGLIVAWAGDAERAALHLEVAIEAGGGDTAKEAKAFREAYGSVRPLTCLLTITGNVYDAEIAIDGEAAQTRIGAAFHLYVKPGLHVVVGRSNQHGEARVEVECPKGKHGTAALQWAQRQPPNPPDPEPIPEQRHFRVPDSMPRAPTRTGSKWLADIGALVDPPMSPQEDPYSDYSGAERPRTEPSKLRVTFGIGPTAIFGVASWAPAFGASLFGGIRFHDVFSLNLEGRAAWLTSEVADKPITAMTGGGLLSACGHWRAIFGCGVTHLGIVRVQATADSYKQEAFVFFTPGLGGRLGGDIPISDAFSVRASAEAMVLPSKTLVQIGPTVYANQPPVMLGASVAALWQF
jgi:hypothetical protein